MKIQVTFLTLNTYNTITSYNISFNVFKASVCVDLQQSSSC